MIYWCRNIYIIISIDGLNKNLGIYFQFFIFIIIYICVHFFILVINDKLWFINLFSTFFYIWGKKKLRNNWRFNLKLNWLIIITLFLIKHSNIYNNYLKHVCYTNLIIKVIWIKLVWNMCIGWTLFCSRNYARLSVNRDNPSSKLKI